MGAGVEHHRLTLREPAVDDDAVTRWACEGRYRPELEHRVRSCELGLRRESRPLSAADELSHLRDVEPFGRGDHRADEPVRCGEPIVFATSADATPTATASSSAVWVGVCAIIS